MFACSGLSAFTVEGGVFVRGREDEAPAAACALAVAKPLVRPKGLGAFFPFLPDSEVREGAALPTLVER